ncbi:MAG: hypothetical protein NC338_08160 [Firmicutes bacterium]|nr:hypothetical protein [Bacillota bacterium]MCM1400538.1 hypothetical protein [Bacteroides sp.]MCM1476442.1 hypothetical protein [Bacteroides sp.]
MEKEKPLSQQSEHTDGSATDNDAEDLRLSLCRRSEHHEPPRGKLSCYDWMADIPGAADGHDMVEVQFKNTRKGFYLNSLHIPLKIGDIVAVEAAPGHDIGEVTLTGPLVERQMKRANTKPNAEVRRVLRKARQADLDRFDEAKAKENDTMIRSRKIAEDLHLNMKIGDVEYQGDGNKAIFYYIADERVDFRQLIKVLAETFKVRIEMKQIGARQEAGRIGGIGPCGRPLCCASWMTNFVSVGTAAARFQDISLNPQKLAGQCAKLKCCLNFEVDAYVESIKHLPPKDVRLETADSTYFHFKYDVFNRTVTYSTDKSVPANLVTLTADRAFEVIAMNKAGEKPVSLLPEGDETSASKKPYADLLGQDSIARFDNAKKKKKCKPKPKAQKEEEAQQPEAENPKPAKGTKNRQDRRKPKPSGAPKKGDNTDNRQGERKPDKGQKQKDE